MFSWDNTKYDLIYANSHVKREYEKCEHFDIRRYDSDRHIEGVEIQQFDQRAYVDIISRNFGRSFVDLTEHLRGQGFFVAWENAEHRAIDPWGARIVWIPIANSSGKVFMTSEQLKKLNSILKDFKLNDQENKGWGFRLKENFKPIKETGDGFKMCLFLNRESNISIENNPPWLNDSL